MLPPCPPQAAKRTDNWLSFGQHLLNIKYWIKKGQLGGGVIFNMLYTVLLNELALIPKFTQQWGSPFREKGPCTQYSLTDQ